MPIVKNLLTLPEGFAVTPVHSYVRVAKVLTVSLISRDMVVQFIDGDIIDGVNMEEPVTVTSVVGSDDTETTYAPSATVYGRGDLAAIMILVTGEMYAVSPMDLYTHVNRENFALFRDWILYDVLQTLMVDFLDSGENSYITFWNPATHAVVKICADPDTKPLFRRLIDHFIYDRQGLLDMASTNTFYPYEKLSGGPPTNVQFLFHDKMYEGKFINGLQYVEEHLYGQADLTADLSVFDPVLTNLKTAYLHPWLDANGYSTLNIRYDSATVVWFGEEDPTHVLLICCYPAWDTCKYVKFIEVPVYCLAGRKFLERDENGDIVLSWQRYGDQVRLIKTIERSYVDWNALGADYDYAEKINRALPVYVPRLTGSDEVTFGFIDGYPYDQGGSLFDTNKLKKVEGVIKRTKIDPELGSYWNGSRYRYEITHNNPVATGTVDNWYSIKFEYFADGVDIWERQTHNNPAKVFPHFTDGTNAMHRTLDFNFYCDGYYEGALVDGRTSWSDRSDGVDNAQLFLNEFWHKMYLNDTILWTDYFKIEKNQMFVWGEQTYHFVHYSDIDYGLFVIEKIRTVIDETGESFGPGSPCTGSTTRSGIILFGGVEYVIWEFTETLSTFPTVWNFFPWVADSGAPERPSTAPYSVNTDHNCAFMYGPFYDYYTDPIAGLTALAFDYPGPAGDTCSTLYVGHVDANDNSKRTDYLQVSIDRVNDSFAVRWPCHLQEDPPTKTVSYPNIGNTAFRFNGGAIHFNNPAVTVTINL